MADYVGESVDAVIKESDLISFDGSIGKLGKQLKGLEKTIEEVANAISSKAPKMRSNIEAMVGGGGITLDFYDKVRAAADSIDSLYAAQMKLAKSMTETAKTVALANEAAAQNAKANKLAAQEQLAASGSIDQMKAKLKQLTIEWNALSDAERNGTKGDAVVNSIIQQTIAIDKLNNEVKQEIKTQEYKAKLQRRVADALSAEAREVSALRQETNTLNRQRELEVKMANAAEGSYNQLAAAYELGKLKLKAMAHETEYDIQLFEVESKRLAQLYQQMMAMQEATGKHTLSVGDYGKAIRSISTETAMLVRELPSLAVSANTFFLAISNNLPMFMSAVKRMREENKALAAQGLATQSVFKSIMSSVFGWQTAIILALTLLSKYGSKVVETFKNAFKHVSKLSNEMQAFSAQMGVLGDASKEVAKNNIELTLIVDRLKSCERGTKDWRDGIAAVNEITHKNLDATTATISAIEDVTDAYMKQALQLAINESVVKRLADETVKTSGINQAALPTTTNDFFSLLPDSFMKDGKDTKLSDKDRAKLEKYHTQVVEEFQKIIDSGAGVNWNKLGVQSISSFKESLAKGEQEYNISLADDIVKFEELNRRLSVARKRQEQASQSSGAAYREAKKANDTEIAALTTQINSIAARVQAAKNTLGLTEDLFKAVSKQRMALRGYWPEMTSEAKEAIESMYDIEELLKKQRKSGRTYTAKDVDFDPFFERLANAKAMKEVGENWLETAKYWLERELAIEQVTYEKSEAQRQKFWKKQLKNLEFNHKHGLITEQDYIDALGAEQIKGLSNDQKFVMMRTRILAQQELDLQALANKHESDQQKLREKSWNDEAKGWKQHFAEQTKDLTDSLKKATSLESAKADLASIQALRIQVEGLKPDFERTADGAKMFDETTQALDNSIDSAEVSVAKLDIELTKLDTNISRFGRANSMIGAKRNLQIATDNIDALSKSIQHLRDEQSRLEKGSNAWKEYEDEIKRNVSQLQNNLNRVDVSKMVGQSDIIEGAINSAIDAASPGELMNTMKRLGFGDVVNTYLKEAFAEAGDADVWAAFSAALSEHNGDVEAAIASLEPDMQDAVTKVLHNVGMKAGDDLSVIFSKIWAQATSWFKDTMGYLQDLAQAYADLAQAKADAAAEATEAAQEEYEKEKSLLDAGYANRVETKWAEYQEMKAIQKQAEADAKHAAQVQADIETAQQSMSLITAIANIFSVMTKLGPWGVAAAGVMSASMLAAFVASKAKAKEAALYGEGHAELITGGSHASGNDSPLAYDSKGRERRVEGGEVFGVFRRRAVAEIGASTLIKHIDEINKGNYSDFITGGPERRASLNMLTQTIEAPRANLSALENGVNSLVKQGDRDSYFDGNGNLVIQTKCSRTTYIRR